MVWLMLLLSFTPQDKDFVTYTEAHKIHEETKAPIIVIVSEPWCGPCTKMKEQLRLIRKQYPMIVLAVVSTSEARRTFPHYKTTESKGIPQTFMYVYDNDEKKRYLKKTLIGLVTKQQIYKEWGIPE